MADVAYVRMTNCSFGYTAFAADMFARRIVGRAYATAMGIGGLPLRALEQAVSWAASHGGADGLVHRSGHGARCIGLVYVTGVGEFGMPPPRPARSATRTATPWPGAPMARAGPSLSGGASPSGI